jgi:sugar lactone lactonase YvrE
MAAGPDGSLYVLEISKPGLLTGPPGALIRVAPNGTRTELVPGELFFPGGLVFGPDGALYVTNGGILPGGGTVLRIVP